MLHLLKYNNRIYIFFIPTLNDCKLNPQYIIRIVLLWRTPTFYFIYRNHLCGIGFDFNNSLQKVARNIKTDITALGKDRMTKVAKDAFSVTLFCKIKPKLCKCSVNLNLFECYTYMHTF